MALLSVNLTDVDASGPPQMEPGVYDLESTKVGVNPPVDDKAASVDITFRDSNADATESGPSVQKRFSFSEKAKPYFKRWLLAAGRDDLAEAEEIESEELMGLVAKAVVNHETVTDKVTGEVRTFARVARFINLPAEEDTTTT